MKKLLLPILLFLVNMAANAQTYTPFPDAHSIWLIRHGNGEAPPDFYYLGLTNKDTVINSVIYRKLFKSADTAFDNSEYYAGLRQDVAARKVYWYDHQQNIERLLYDFSVGIGDTVQYASGVGSQAIVSSIDSILIFGSYHRKINFTIIGTPSEFMFGSWVEGMGNTATGGLLGPTIDLPTCDCGDKLICWKKDHDWRYHNPNYDFIDCPLPLTGVTEMPGTSHEALLYPNPVTGTSRLQLSSSEPLLQVSVYNVTGVRMKTYRPSGIDKDILLDRADYIPGCYYYHISGRSGSTATGKFVVE